MNLFCNEQNVIFYFFKVATTSANAVRNFSSKKLCNSFNFLNFNCFNVYVYYEKKIERKL